MGSRKVEFVGIQPLFMRIVPAGSGGLFERCCACGAWPTPSVTVYAPGHKLVSAWSFCSACAGILEESGFHPRELLFEEVPAGDEMKCVRSWCGRNLMWAAIRLDRAERQLVERGRGILGNLLRRWLV